MLRSLIAAAILLAVCAPSASAAQRRAVHVQTEVCDNKDVMRPCAYQPNFMAGVRSINVTLKRDRSEKEGRASRRLSRPSHRTVSRYGAPELSPGYTIARPAHYTALKAAIAAGHTPIIGLTLYESFESDAVAKSGIVSMPAKHEKTVGGHCMYVVGYGQKPGCFTVRNSWAADWGDKGDCYFPEAYLGSTILGSDYWIITAEGARR